MQKDLLMPLKPMQEAIVLSSLSYSVVFYIWRLIHTFHPDYPIYSAIFFTAEVIGFISMALFVWSTYFLKKRTSLPILSQPSVDVYITTYNEDPELLRTSIYHCVTMDYPHQTYVLDDGHRPEVESLARELGAQYLTRFDNRHAKAGNMNAAMARTQGDLIAVFDADGVPRKDFLTKLVGYFEDASVSFVQTPQSLYNLDSFTHSTPMRNGELWNDQSLFYDICQSGRDYWGASTCCGNGSIMRRSALESIGGFTTETVTEDFHTTLRLQAKGYTNIYHAEPLAFCLSPANLYTYIIQRRRWALGSIQMLRAEWKTILGPSRLTLPQRLSYLSTLYYFTSIQKVLYYIAPALCLTVGFSPIAPSVESVPFLIQMTLSLAAFYILGRGRVRLFLIELFSVYTLIPHLRAIPLGFSPILKRTFDVTPKRPDAMGSNWQIFMPSVVIGLSSIALFAFIWKATFGMLSTSDLLSSLIAGFYLAVGVGAMKHSQYHPVSSKAYSFFDPRPFTIYKIDSVKQRREYTGIVTAICENQVSLSCSKSLALNARLELNLSLPRLQVPILCQVTRTWEIRSELGSSPIFKVEAKILSLSRKTKIEMIRYQFEDAIPSAFRPVEVTQELPPEKRKQGRELTLVPGFIGSGRTGHEEIGLVVDFSTLGARLQLSRELAIGAEIQVRMPWLKHTFRARVQRCQRDQNRLSQTFDVGVLAFERHGLIKLQTGLARL